jgi:mono/diheme cytochrome c family protein
MSISHRAAVLAAIVGMAALCAGPARAATPTPAAASADNAAQVRRGHELALQICASCHVVASDQSARPLLKPPAPEFRVIANRASTTAASLTDFLQVPHGKMPNPMLAEYQVTALTAYIMSLRNK